MKIASGAVFTQTGVKITFSELLNRIPDNNWTWSLFEFEGIAISPYEMGIPEFEDLLANARYGVNFSWDELTRFGTTVSDIHSCVVAAVTHPVEYSALAEGATAGVIVLIRIIDSTEWNVVFF